ncbi:15050_t:CDS:2, partial [Gigaspora rosea]
VILNDVVRFTTLDPENLPVFPIIINMIALVKEDPKINKKDVTITIIAKNYINQGDVYIDMICYHLTSTQHLMNVTIVVKKYSVVYVNEELILTDNSRIVHIQNLSFPEFQKESKDQVNADQCNTVAHTIATRVKGNTQANKILNKDSNSNAPNSTVHE